MATYRISHRLKYDVIISTTNSFRKKIMRAFFFQYQINILPSNGIIEYINKELLNHAN